MKSGFEALERRRLCEPRRRLFADRRVARATLATGDYAAKCAHAIEEEVAIRRLHRSWARLRREYFYKAHGIPCVAEVARLTRQLGRAAIGAKHRHVAAFEDGRPTSQQREEYLGAPAGQGALPTVLSLVHCQSCDRLGVSEGYRQCGLRRLAYHTWYA